MKKIMTFILAIIMLFGTMGAVDVKVSALPSATSINDADLFMLIQTSSKKVTASVVQSYVLEGVTIGGSGSTDITTNNGTQTLTNKTLTAPVIGGTAVTASGAEINVLDGIPVGLTATELGYVDGVTSPIQTQINELASASAQPYASYQWATTWVQSGTDDKVIAASTILTALGNPSGKVISPVLQYNVWIIDSGRYTPDDVVYVTYTIDQTGVNHLDEITLGTLSNGVNYAVGFTFRLIANGL